MVASGYTVEVNNEHVIVGNAALLKCVIPSFVSDFVVVASWTVDDAAVLDGKKKRTKPKKRRSASFSLAVQTTNQSAANPTAAAVR